MSIEELAQDLSVLTPEFILDRYLSKEWQREHKFIINIDGTTTRFGRTPLIK
jgi:hypothetical protein